MIRDIPPQYSPETYAFVQEHIWFFYLLLVLCLIAIGYLCYRIYLTEWKPYLKTGE